MTKQLIPDVKYEISEDGSFLEVEQGEVEPVSIHLHKMHIKHIANLMKVNDVEDDNARLTDHLEQMNQKAEELYNKISAIPMFPPSDQITDEERLAEELHKLANTTLGLWGVGY